VLAQWQAWRLPTVLGTRRAMMLAAAVPGVLYLAMAGIGNAWLAVVLFVVQWGAMHLLGPILSGLYNAHIPSASRATTLSLISALVTIYIGAGGVFLGWLAERSLAGTYALLGAVIVAGAVLIPVDERHAVATSSLAADPVPPQ